MSDGLQYTFRVLPMQVAERVAAKGDANTNHQNQTELKQQYDRIERNQNFIINQMQSISDRLGRIEQRVDNLNVAENNLSDLNWLQ